MNVKITNETYLNGLPIPEGYSIEINGVEIKLKSEDFKELLKEMDKKISKNHEKTVELYEKYNEKVKTFENFKKDIIRIFWDGDPDNMDDWLTRKNAKNIDSKKLDDVLDKYSKILGF